MKKIVFYLILVLLCAGVPKAETLQELWEKYSPAQDKADQAAPAEAAAKSPGRIIGNVSQEGESAFDYPWRYRRQTWEGHFENPEELAKSIHALAIHVHDVDESLPREKFYKGVLGFHYSVSQLLGWLNDPDRKPLSPGENVFVGRLLEDGVLKLGAHGFESGGGVTHVLGAAGGRKRPFQVNLRHERLHVFWDEDEAFRNEQKAKWNALDDSEKALIKKDMKNYSQSNEKQLMEEWAIKGAETSAMSIK